MRFFDRRTSGSRPCLIMALGLLLLIENRQGLHAHPTNPAEATSPEIDRPTRDEILEVVRQYHAGLESFGGYDPSDGDAESVYRERLGRWCDLFTETIHQRDILWRAEVNGKQALHDSMWPQIEIGNIESIDIDVEHVLVEGSRVAIVARWTWDLALREPQMMECIEWLEFQGQRISSSRIFLNYPPDLMEQRAADCAREARGENQLVDRLSDLEFMKGVWIAQQTVFPSGGETRQLPKDYCNFHPVLGGQALSLKLLADAGLGTEAAPAWFRIHLSHDQFHEVYRMTVLDDLSGYLDVYEGDFEEEELVLCNEHTGTSFPQSGGTLISEIRIRPFPEEGFTMEVHSSLDGGDTWTLASRLTFE